MSDRDTPLNVVLITAHDLGRHLDCYGIETVDTPNLDSLAESGVLFEDAIATSPVCTPARGSLLTGRYPQSNGLMSFTHPPWNWRMDDGERVLSQLLGDADYETHLAGVQHVAPEDDPERLEFDHYYDPSNVPDAEDVTAAATEIFSDAADPFYAQFGFFEAHRPFEHGESDENGVYVPPFLEEEEYRDDFAAYQASIEYLDARVGDILDSLDASGRREETVVVFAADHGIPFSGAKWWLRSPGVEVALIADGPTPAFRNRDAVESVVSTVDLVPTILDVLDLQIPDNIQGRSLRPFLDGETEDAPRDAAYTQYTAPGNSSRGVVTGDYTLIRNFGTSPDYPWQSIDESPTGGDGMTGPPRTMVELYDRRDDPFNLTDVADERPEVVDRLSGRVRRWMARADDPLLHGGVRSPYEKRAVRDLLSGSE